MSDGAWAASACRVADDGWVQGARRLESPNFDARPVGCRIELLVLHCISLPPGCFGNGDIERLFSNQLDCSAHALSNAVRVFSLR